MKRFVSALLFSAVCAFAADVTGNWSGALEGTKPDGSPFTDTAQFKLKQEGTKLTGTGGGPNDGFEVQNGKVEGNDVTFELIPPGDRGMLKLTLKLNGDTMTGNVTRERNGRSQTAKLSLKREK